MYTFYLNHYLINMQQRTYIKERTTNQFFMQYSYHKEEIYSFIFLWQQYLTKTKLGEFDVRYISLKHKSVSLQLYHILLDALVQ